MNIIDISNWTISEINNSINTFKYTSLTDIGMVNCDIESINIVGEVATATLWINEDIGIDGYTGTAPLKIYKEDKVEIKLNSPLLEGDSIEVHNSKLCHYHRYGKVVLDGSEDWEDYLASSMLEGWIRFRTFIIKDCLWGSYLLNNRFSQYNTDYLYGGLMMAWSHRSNDSWNFIVESHKLSTPDVNGFKQWLQANPITVIYELTEPYYEDITPLQSSIILKTFNESSMIINTNLPIETKLSYRTSVPSISTLSNRVTEVSESDNIIQNLIDIIDDEVDE